MIACVLRCSRNLFCDFALHLMRRIINFNQSCTKYFFARRFLNPFFHITKVNDTIAALPVNSVQNR